MWALAVPFYTAGWTLTVPFFSTAGGALTVPFFCTAGWALTVPFYSTAEWALTVTFLLYEGSLWFECLPFTLPYYNLKGISLEDLSHLL